MHIQRSRHAPTLTLITAVGASLVAGACAEPIDLGTDQAAVTAEPIDRIALPPESGTCPTIPTDVARSLVVTAATHPGLTTRFTFARVMKQILETGGAAQSQTKLTMYQQWMASFGQPACSAAGIDPEGYGLPCPRSPEALLATADPFDPAGAAPFTAIGLFNRFDLTPQTGETCGEHRIVFALPSGLRRAFIIFEAALPNPQPALGVDGCYPVTRFWQSLSGLTPTARLDALEAFYFTGVVEPITGVTIGPVVTAQNYGLEVRTTSDPVDEIPIPLPTPLPELMRRADDLGGRVATAPGDRTAVMRYGGTGRFGQIRTNMFVNFNEWNLREFKMLLDCTGATRACQLRFEHLPVAANPADELFVDGHPRGPEFQDGLLKQVAGLARATDPNQIALATESVHDEFESAPQRDDVDFGAPGHASAGLRAAIQVRLTAIGSTLTPTNILDRVRTQTCAGCHLRSNSNNLGGGVVWPPDAGFVHITEAGSLSGALTGVFLPRRRVVLDEFIAARCDPSQPLPGPIDEQLTVSGAPVGASN